jgi:murein DD-endopeptidase MepM/ murein hydrolase activator NlpD
VRRTAIGLFSGSAVIAAVSAPLGLLSRRAQTVGPEPLAVVVHASERDAGSAAPAVEIEPPPPHVWRVSDLAAESDVEVKDAAVGKRTMLAAMLGAGIPAKEAMRVLHAFDPVHKLDRCSPRDTFQWAKKNGRIIAFEYRTSPAEVWQAKENEKGELEAKKLDLLVKHARVATAAIVTSDLRDALSRAGLHEELAEDLDDALAARIDLADIKPGTRLRVVATEEDIEARFSRYTEVLAVDWIAPGRPPLRVYGFHAGNVTRFYDGKGHAPYRGAWRSPIPMARISSRFNMHRVHPVLHVVMPHNGVDFAAPPGTPVYAAAAGTVKTVGDGGPCGNMVQIEHAGSIVSSYCHLSRFAPGLHPGEHVEPRALVGYVGQTGRATGPHLHFAVKRGDVFIDPLSMKLDGVHVLAPKEKEPFEQFKNEMDAALDAIALPDAPEDVDAGAPLSDEDDLQE